MKPKPIPTPNTAKLLRAVAGTRAVECDCAACQRDLGELVEAELAGKAVTGALEMTRHHLRMCRECEEEFETLLVIERQERS